MQLDSLFPELLLLVAQYLSRHEWKHLRLTCKTLAGTFAALVVDKVIINGDKDDVLDVLNILSGHALMSPPLYAIKTLWISTLSRSLIDRKSDNQTQDPGRDSVYLNLLLSALSRLNHIQRIRWEIHVFDNMAFMTPVAEVVTKYQKLEDLNLVIMDAPPLPILGRFRDLTSIHYANLDLLSAVRKLRRAANAPQTLRFRRDYFTFDKSETTKLPFAATLPPSRTTSKGLGHI
ncbi:hypothetical protein BJ165DRAFT_1531962 [Panaeolus papilionaceus]|nr:hypothetical protein BJ165DRAFT_1531962 [Panaeolus papilionaceus]